MYCSACGTPVAPGISFCNRCGQSLKDRDEQRPTAAITAFLVAITLIGIIGLGIMFGGTLTLRKEANFGEDILGVFMMFTFLTVGLIEILLFRQLSKLLSGNDRKQAKFVPPHVGVANELLASQPRSLAEPIPSVTENTTRTLEYSRNEPVR